MSIGTLLGMLDFTRMRVSNVRTDRVVRRYKGDYADFSMYCPKEWNDAGKHPRLSSKRKSSGDHDESERSNRKGTKDRNKPLLCPFHMSSIHIPIGASEAERGSPNTVSSPSPPSRRNHIYLSIAAQHSYEVHHHCSVTCDSHIDHVIYPAVP